MTDDFRAKKPRMIWSKIRDAAIMVGITVVAVFLLTGTLELYFRYVSSFGSVSWPVQFDPKVGFIFTPGAEVRWTNNLDYWTIQKANKWGFLDREPPASEPRPEQCEIAFLGDSFVEAAQVPIVEKFHILLETMAREKLPGLRVKASAFGYSGTGQLNQLAFYDEFARELRPKIVVLVFVGNDFANNSRILEGIRNGWEPAHTPRIFARKNADGSIVLQPIDPAWNKHVLNSPPSRQSWRSINHGRIMQRSAFYRWFYTKLTLLHPGVARMLSGGSVGVNTAAFNAEQLSRQPEYAEILRGWDPVKNPDVDAPFDSDALPPVFEQAVDYTGFALDQYLERARRDSFRLVILAQSKLGPQIKRLLRLAQARNVSVVEQLRYIETVGGDPVKAHFPHDGHWSPQGHRWAAEAMLQFLTANPDYCLGSAAAARAQ